MASFTAMLPLLGQAAAQPELAFHQQGWFRAVAALLIIAASWGLGKWLSKVWRMPDYSFRFGLILFAMIAGVVICAWRWPPKLGIDLKGGVILIYEVAESQQPTVNLAEPLDRIRNYLDNRVNVETQVAARGADQIAVTAPADDADVLDNIESTVEGIPFDDVTVSAADRQTQDGRTTIVFNVQGALASDEVDTGKLIAALNRRINPGGQKEVVIRKFGDRQVEIIIPEVDPNEIDLIKQKISTAGLLEFRILANQVDHAPIIEQAANNPLSKEVVADGRVIARWVILDTTRMQPDERMQTRTNRAGETEVLVAIDPYNVTGGYLARAMTGHDEVGRPAVDFAFNAEGAVAFGELTGENTPDQTTGFHRRLGIILDGRLFSAPELRSAITSRGQITGDFRIEEVQFLVEILNAGHLPAALDKTPVSQTSISPQLGADTIRNGSISMIVATAMILVFMLVYYRFSGLVADIAVVLNVVLVVALMITLNAAFTLSGLAGLVLSVGMAVDANVLIYERMREELQRGAALRMAIRNGFGRATTAIIDSNITTLLTGVVLYAIGTDQLKGFAITLILGLLLNLFSAVYVARVIFDVAERRRWISELKMMQMFAVPNINFVRGIKFAVATSVLIFVAGLIAAGSRGEGLFGIDFTGGTSVQIVLQEDEKLTVGEVRDIVDPQDAQLPRLDDVTVSSVGLPDADGKNRYYKIDTSLASIAEVEERLKELFADKLEVYEMTYTPPAAIPGAAAGPADTGSGDSDLQKNDDAKKAETAKEPAKTPTEQDSKDAAAPKEKASPEPNTQKDLPPPPADDKAAAPTGGSEVGGSEKAESEKRDSEKVDSEKRDSEKANDVSPDDNQPQAALFRIVRPWLALSAPHTLALLQDDKQQESKDAAAQPAPTTDQAQADKGDAAKNAAPDSGKDAAPVPEEPAAPGKNSAETSPAKSSADSPAATSSAPIAEATEQGPSPFAGGSQTTLRFKEGINSDALLAKLEAAAAALQLAPAQFLLDEDQATQDALNTRLFRGWEVQTTLTTADAQKVLDRVQGELSQTPIFLGANNIGGKVAGHARVMAIYAILASMVMIVIYVWVRFQNIVFGLASVVAIVHDVLVTVAAIAISYYVAPYLGWAMVDPFKISLDVVAALLTIVGFSINDTIVIFDRIREIKGKSPQVTADMVNKAVNQTLGRTVLTNGTVLIVTIILYVWAGQEIHAFAFAMLVGIVAGTYSTIYIASPLVLWLRKPVATHRPTSQRGSEVAMRA